MSTALAHPRICRKGRWAFLLLYCNSLNPDNLYSDFWFLLRSPLTQMCLPKLLGTEGEKVLWFHHFHPSSRTNPIKFLEHLDLLPFAKGFLVLRVRPTRKTS